MSRCSSNEPYDRRCRCTTRPWSTNGRHLIQRHIAPLFSRVLANDRVYLANHSLGRPLDAIVRGRARSNFVVGNKARRCMVCLACGTRSLPRSHCRTHPCSARGLHRAEDICRTGPADRVECAARDPARLEYAWRIRFHRPSVETVCFARRIELSWVEADAEGRFTVPGIIRHLRQNIDLVVISQVLFINGQVVHDLEQLADACHSVGAKLLVDSYHAIGVFPVDVAAIRADFAIGGSYKYLRGGPGACFLYLSPEILARGLRPLDTGWFARENMFGYERHDPPLLRAGGDAFLESTPPVLTYYQARSGQRVTLAITVERLREYGQKQLSQLKLYLADAGIEAIGGDDNHGAFLSFATRMPATLQKNCGKVMSLLTLAVNGCAFAPIASRGRKNCEQRLLTLHKTLEQMYS